MKCIVLAPHDVNPGPTATEIVLLCHVRFCGSDIPGGVGVFSDSGPDGNGVPIPVQLTGITAASYSNAVEDAMIARAVAIGGLPVLARTDVFFPPYSRGT